MAGGQEWRSEAQKALRHSAFYRSPFWASYPNVNGRDFLLKSHIDLVNGGYPILLIEDSPDDVMLIERAFHRADLHHPLRTVTDGQKAIEYLKGLEEYSDRAAYPYPGLVILDLKIPGVDGFDVIRWMRSHPQAKLVPIIVLSSSSQPEDINRAYELGANAFMVKPANHRALEQLLSTIGEFWLASEGPRPGFSARSTAMLL